MTETWKRALAVRRMREDPSVSYRALGKVLDVSDSTIRAWRDEEGIEPRDDARSSGPTPRHHRGRRTGSRPWIRSSEDGADDVDVDLADEDYDDDQEEEEPDQDLENDEPISIPYRRVASPVPVRPTAKGSPSPVERMRAMGPMGRVAASRGTTLPRRPDPNRLRAITAELDASHPPGRHAVALLVEAASFLTGGVVALQQYGDARGCRPEDIAAAERIVVGGGRPRGGGGPSP